MIEFVIDSGASFGDAALRHPVSPRRHPFEIHSSVVRWLFVVAVFTLLLQSMSASAQQVYGTLTGNITDSSGAAIRNARVTIRETGKNITYSVQTNASGLYSKGQLIDGTYTATIEAPGFTKVVSSPLTVRSDDVTRFNASLSTGSSEQTVMVTDKAPLLQTDSADVATTLTSHQILNVSDYQRNFFALEYAETAMCLPFGVLTS